MDEEDEDAGVVELAWKAALDANALGAGGRAHAGEDEDEDAFAKLDEALGSYAAAAVASSAPAPHEQHHGLEQARSGHAMTLDSSTHGHGHEPTDVVVHLDHATAQSPSGAGQRFKRKNFSKELQLLSLQRYADYAREVGKLPDRDETQELLQQSYLQFLKNGGAPDEPRLTPPEFLKLIRNRRREIHARSQQQNDPPVKTKSKKRVRTQSVTAAKRKLQEENEKIRELIEVIDRARGRSQHRSNSHRVSSRALFPSQHPAEEMPSLIESLPALSADPQDKLEAILQIHKETREVQSEIAERIESIQRMIHHHDSMEEPSSASV